MLQRSEVTFIWNIVSKRQFSMQIFGDLGFFCISRPNKCDHKYHKAGKFSNHSLREKCVKNLTNSMIYLIIVSELRFSFSFYNYRRRQAGIFSA